MRNLFPGYYRPTQEEFKKLWQEGIFTFDTNVLLHVYRYTPETREQLFTILKGLQTRIWLAHQTAYEFHKDRVSVIIAQTNAYESVEKSLEAIGEALAKVSSTLSQFRRHPFINENLVAVPIKRSVEGVTESLRALKAKHPDFLAGDTMLETLGELFHGNVGTAYSPERLAQICKEGEERYKLEIPPGYKDSKDKKGEEKYGDLVLWFQIIEHAKAQQRPIILVTDDTKEDWWWRQSGITIGPRPELVEEMLHKAGVQFYMYTAERFIQQAQAFLGIQGGQSARAVQEAREVREQQEQAHLSGSYERVLTALHDWTPLPDLQRSDSAHRFLERVAQTYYVLLEGREPISDEHALNLTFLVQAVGQRLTELGDEDGPGIVLRELRNRYHIARLQDLPETRYLDAIGWLVRWFMKLKAPAGQRDDEDTTDTTK